MRWTVIEHGGKPVSAGPSALLAAPGGTIGRSPDNHLVLPDEQRQISRLQATVRFDEDGGAVLRNMSAVLPISVNGRTLRHEEESRVTDGDRVAIGSYVLEAANAQRAAGVTVMPHAASPVQPAPHSPPAQSQSSPSPLSAAPLSAVPAPAPFPSFPPAPAHPPAMPPQAAPMDALLPGASGGSDVFSDLFGEGALPIGDTHPAPPPARPASPPVHAAPPAFVPPAAPAVLPPAIAPAWPAGTTNAPASLPSAFQPAFAPGDPFAAPGPASAPSQSASAFAGTPAPAHPQLPSAADWDAILANAPRRSDHTSAPMPDPMAHEPFELPSQARRNPVDPLAELNPDKSATDMSDIALKRGMDPLSFFAADSHAPSPLSDPRPTALTHEDPLREMHPAMDLLGKPPAAQGYSHSNHAREVAAQFRPPNPVAFDPPPATPVKVEAAAPAPAPAPPAPPQPPFSPPASPVEMEKMQVQATAPAPTEPEPTVAPPPVAPARVEIAPTPVDAAPPREPAPPVAEPGPRPEQAAAPQATVPIAAPLSSAAIGSSAEPQPVAAAVPAASPASVASHDELFCAFLEGAGVPDVAGQQPLDAEAMRRLGRLMRAFTDGTIELLSSRAMLKREVRAEITMIVDEENNPFKILPNGRAVLMQMFGARMPGFLTPEAAVHDALGDLQSHQLGMVAGMRAALLTVLKRFDPQALNSTTPHDGSLGEKLLPGGREARLWRQMQQLHAETTAAVEDDFQAVFGRAFQQAYDKEMERLKEARRA